MQFETKTRRSAAGNVSLLLKKRVALREGMKCAAGSGLRLACLFPGTALLLVLMGTVCVGTVRSPAQQTNSRNGASAMRTPPDEDPLYSGRDVPADQTLTLMEQRRMKALNLQVQKSMLSDADKLFKLATELNAEVNGAHSGQLTADQIEKVAEIEKLARSVRDKMSRTELMVRPSPTPEPELASPFPVR